RMTLTYGVRWELNPAPSGGNGDEPLVLANLDNPARLTVAPKGTPLFETRYAQVAPRAGVAYELSQVPGRATVLRGGFGVVYDLARGPAASGLGYAYPLFRSKIRTAVAFPWDASVAAPPPVVLTPPYGQISGVLDPNLSLPRTHQWNVTVEQAFGPNQII